MIGVMKKFSTNWEELQSMLDQGYELPEHGLEVRILRGMMSPYGVPGWGTP